VWTDFAGVALATIIVAKATPALSNRVIAIKKARTFDST
jgi:hypothetical protein